MLGWLRTKNHRELPHYSQLKAVPSRGLPAALDEQERGESFGIRRDAIERELLEPTRCPPDDKPLLTSVLVGKGVLSITEPDSKAQCVLVFSTPLRAADYARTLLAPGPSVRYLAASALQFTRMLRDLEKTAVKSFTVDRCPRCSIFTVIGTGSIRGVADVVRVLAIFKATELARTELYLTYALDAARAGRLKEACNVALEAVGHVTLEDRRLHLLLG